MPRIKLREYRSSVHKPPQKCTQLNGRMHVHVVWECMCHHHQTGLLCATSTVFVSVVIRICHTMVYRFKYATMQVCAQMHKGVHVSQHECTDVHVKVDIASVAEWV